MALASDYLIECSCCCCWFLSSLIEMSVGYMYHPHPHPYHDIINNKSNKKNNSNWRKNKRREKTIHFFTSSYLKRLIMKMREKTGFHFSYYFLTYCLSWWWWWWNGMNWWMDDEDDGMSICNIAFTYVLRYARREYIFSLKWVMRCCWRLPWCIQYTLHSITVDSDRKPKQINIKHIHGAKHYIGAEVKMGVGCWRVLQE